MMLVTLYEGGM
ncbi:hypothetical protein SS209_02783 [Salmonella enterica subsp. enterica serovar Senftenberg str. SS209]|nr:hypothetical protein SS209_02783 [Salmonella enterica subsp. enterica serovar Senftenberg str. SS209]